jgi:hypothetical protein
MQGVQQAAWGGRHPASRRSVNNLIIPRWQCASGAAPEEIAEERRMQFTIHLLVGAMGLVLATSAHATSWTSAKFPGEQNRAVQGCADDARNPGDWFCILIRCDKPGSPLSLYFSAPGPDIRGDVKLVIDERSFPVSVPASLKSPLPLSTRAEALPYALIDAMKAGSAISVQGSHLQAPYNRISLENSRNAIERVEWVCERPYPSVKRFWRRLTRSLRLP